MYNVGGVARKVELNNILLKCKGNSHSYILYKMLFFFSFFFFGKLTFLSVDDNIFGTGSCLYRNRIYPVSVIGTYVKDDLFSE